MYYKYIIWIWYIYMIYSWYYRRYIHSFINVIFIVLLTFTELFSWYNQRSPNYFHRYANEDILIYYVELQIQTLIIGKKRNKKILNSINHEKIISSLCWTQLNALFKLIIRIDHHSNCSSLWVVKNQGALWLFVLFISF